MSEKRVKEKLKEAEKETSVVRNDKPTRDKKWWLTSIAIYSTVIVVSIVVGVIIWHFI